MKIKYRPHRSTLEESLKESMFFSNISELCNYLGNERLKIEYYAFDDRIKTDLFIVTSKSSIGFMNYED